MKSQVLESSDESFKCDVAFCHNRLEGDKSSKTTWKFCSKTCEDSFQNSVRRHQWTCPTRVVNEEPSIWARNYHDLVAEASLSVDNQTSWAESPPPQEQEAPNPKTGWETNRSEGIAEDVAEYEDQVDSDEEAADGEEVADTETTENLNWSSCIMTDPLLDMQFCGIDTDSGKSISTRLSDFLWLDNSKDARASIEIRGVGGAGTQVGGRGPMAIRVVNNLSHSIILVDPDGVYI